MVSSVLRYVARIALNTPFVVVVCLWLLSLYACAGTLPRLLDTRGSFTSTSQGPTPVELANQPGFVGFGTTVVDLECHRTNTVWLWPIVEARASVRVHRYNGVGERLSPPDGLVVPEATRLKLVDGFRRSTGAPADARLRAAAIRDGVRLTEVDAERVSWWYAGMAAIGALGVVSLVLAARVSEALYVGRQVSEQLGVRAG